MRKVLVAVLTLLLLVSVVGCGSVANTPAKSGPTPVTLALSTWIGYAPLYIAKEKGFFEKHGVDMTLTKMEAVADRRSALAANRIQGFATTVDTHVVTAASGVPVVQVVALDDSYGGDGIVAKKEIKNFKDLVGKTVAVQTDGGASYFWFLYMLKQEGVNAKDIKLQSMGAGDAGAAFVANKVDAAVTWEPWLSKAKETTFGSVLYSSDKTPGVIADTIGLRKDFVDKNPQVVQGIVDAWFDAIDFWKQNPDEANAIMAKAMGQTKEAFVQSLKEVRFYGKAENKEYFGTKEKPGKLYELTKIGNDFWFENKIITKQQDPTSLIDYSFIK